MIDCVYLLASDVANIIDISVASMQCNANGENAIEVVSSTFDNVVIFVNIWAFPTATQFWCTGELNRNFVDKCTKKNKNPFTNFFSVRISKFNGRNIHINIVIEILLPLKKFMTGFLSFFVHRQSAEELVSKGFHWQDEFNQWQTSSPFY